MVLPRLMQSAEESEAQLQLETFHNACQMPMQMLGLHCGPGGPSAAELLATTSQTRMADLRRH